MESGRRAQGCWTCKQRKIGCDRGTPACNNCLRTGRECLGYGIRLAWPDQPDGRRRKSQLSGHSTQLPPSNSKYYGKQFINVTYEDLARIRNSETLHRLILLHVPPHPRRVLPMIPNLLETESQLLQYYRDRVSRMISTIDVNNGFREDLLPMAMSPYGSASEGLRNAIYSVAAFHLWGSEGALPFKAKALRSLSSSLAADSVGISETQLATSMMLCVYNVFDETEGHWLLHLNGAKNILHRLMSFRDGYPRSTFLHTWFLYHEVLGEFIDPAQYHPNGPLSLQVRGYLDIDPTVIVGSLGCSIEVMEVLSYVNGIRARQLHTENDEFSAEEKSRLDDEVYCIESKLANLEQKIDHRYALQLGRHKCAMILWTAELYRIATFLYLQRAHNNVSVHELRPMYLQQAFEVLRSLDVCASPWPLFVLACEADTDEQRIDVLEALDRMESERHIGNIRALRDIVEIFWKQQDMHAETRRPLNPKWWDVIDLNMATPWFI